MFSSQPAPAGEPSRPQHPSYVLYQPQGHTSSIMALQYMPGSRGNLLLSGGSDKSVRGTAA